MKEAKKYHIYLFRHGQTTYNRDQKFTGWQNPPLTSLGKKQAHLLAKKLQHKKFQVAFQTSLERSKQTLNIILKSHPECKTIKEDNRMTERNYGSLNGLTHEKFIDNMGRKLYKLEVEGDLITELSKEDKKRIEHLLGKEEYDAIHRGFNIPPLKGESFADVEKRVHSFVKDLLSFIKKNKVSVAISAHGNSIRLFKKIMEKASVEKTCSWTISHEKVYTYTVEVSPAL